MAEEHSSHLADIARVSDFIRRLSPAGFKAIDTFCDFILPLLQGSSDPRVTAIVGALQASCIVRRAFRRKRRN